MAYRLRALHTLHGAAVRRGACGQVRMMSTTQKKGYWLGNFTPKEGADMEDFTNNYRMPMLASLQEYGGKMLVVTPNSDADYYIGNLGAISWVAEFPSVEQAMKWHESKAYKDLVPCREKHITGNYIVTEGK